jgi:hypothetical protein
VEEERDAGRQTGVLRALGERAGRVELLEVVLMSAFRMLRTRLMRAPPWWPYWPWFTKL